MKSSEKSNSQDSKKLRLDKAAKTIFNSEENEKKETVKQDDEIAKLRDEIALLKAENFNIKTLAALEKSGCLKPELAAKAIPADCENIQEWVDNFKAENEILFRRPPQNHGSNFKPTQSTNLSPVEIMNNYIRGI